MILTKNNINKILIKVILTITNENFNNNKK